MTCVVDWAFKIKYLSAYRWGRGLLGCVVAYTYAEHYVKRFAVTLCSKKLDTKHNVPLHIREDLGP